MIKPDSSTHILVAQGTQAPGDLRWEEGFDCIGHAIYLLSALENLDEEERNWVAILGDPPAIEGLQELDFPPFYNVCQLEEFSYSFLVFIEEPKVDEIPGMSFNLVEIYLEINAKDSTVQEFRTICERLENYPPLQKFL